MPAFASFLSDQEIMSVAEFVSARLADPASHAASVSEGGQIYRLYCSGCHGASGRGGALVGGINAPPLAKFPAAASLAAMILGPSNMPVFTSGTLDVRQQASVALYVQVLQAPPSPGGWGLGYLGPVAEGLAAAAVVGLLVLVTVWLAWGKERSAPGG